MCIYMYVYIQLSVCNLRPEWQQLGWHALTEARTHGLFGSRVCAGSPASTMGIVVDRVNPKKIQFSP